MAWLSVALVIAEAMVIYKFSQTEAWYDNPMPEHIRNAWIAAAIIGSAVGVWHFRRVAEQDDKKQN